MKARQTKCHSATRAQKWYGERNNIDQMSFICFTLEQARLWTVL